MNSEARRTYITRHDETPANLGYRLGVLVDGSAIVQSYSDGLDNQLTQKGRESARNKGRILANEGIQVVETSELKRAIETGSEIIKGLKTKPSFWTVNPQLRDMSFGYWDGLSLKELQEGRFAEDFFAWQKAEKEGDFTYRIPHSPERFPSPDAFKNAAPTESMEEVIERVSPEIQKAEESGITKLLVGHGHSTKGTMWKISQDSDFAVPKEKLGEIPTPNNVIYRVTFGKDKLIEHFDHEQNKWVEGF